MTPSEIRRVMRRAAGLPEDDQPEANLWLSQTPVDDATFDTMIEKALADARRKAAQSNEGLDQLVAKGQLTKADAETVRRNRATNAEGLRKMKDTLVVMFRNALGVKPPASARQKIEETVRAELARWAKDNGVELTIDVDQETAAVLAILYPDSAPPPPAAPDAAAAAPPPAAQPKPLGLSRRPVFEVRDRDGRPVVPSCFSTSRTGPTQRIA